GRGGRYRRLLCKFVGLGDQWGLDTGRGRIDKVHPVIKEDTSLLLSMPNNLFGGFSGVSPKAWKQKIQYDLKGEDYNTSLVWESPEGIKVKPFYHSDDIQDA